MERELAPEIEAALRGRWEPVYRSQLHYLVTWSTRGRRPVLRDRHILALQQLIQQCAGERDMTLLEVVAGSDHAHVLFGLRPSHSVASAVREMKGRTGIDLLSRFPELRVWLRGNLVWDERYAVETVSPARLDAVRARLRTLHSSPPEELAAAS
ncbi:MAG: IS200/IS605 family transposase [Candidatus Eisenbacteria bacterium]